MTVLATKGSLSVWMETLPWPEEFFSADQLPAFLDDIYVLESDMRRTDDGARVRVALAIEGEVALTIPGLQGTEFVFGSGLDGYTTVTGVVELARDWELRLAQLGVTARIDSNILRPVDDGSGTAPETVDITTVGDVVVTNTFDVRVEGFDDFDLSPAEVGTSGVVVAAENVQFDLSRTGTIPAVEAAGFDRSFVGLFVGEASVELPEAVPVPGDLVLEDCVVGSGGVSGTASLDVDDLDFDEDAKAFTGEGAGELGGFAFGLREVEIEFKQNALVTSTIEGELYLPYLDKRVSVEVGFDLDGSLTVRVTGPTRLGDTADSVDSASGLLTLSTDAFDLEVEHAELTVGDPSVLAISGTVTPTVDAFDIPGLAVERLAIDSNGDVHFEGGWVDLPTQYSLDFYGVTLDVTKLGFGKTDAGENWVGLNGSVTVVEGVPAGASVDGLRIFWDEDGFDRFELDGLGIEFAVPGTLQFKGAVAFEGDEFRGDIELDLVALGVAIDAELVVGEHDDGFTYFGIYLDADLPAGIPLFSTGTGIYGFTGLFTHQLEPGKGAEQKWYDIGGDGATSWYHEGEPGVTDLEKWDPKAGSMGLGAGVTLATLPDNGFSVAGDLLLAVVFPGPIVMLQGRADLLREGTNTSDDAAFQSVAVLDNRAGSFTFGMDAQYQKGGEDGALIDIRGGVEAFFSFHDPTAWYLNLGRKEPPEDRIRAEALYLFTADAYFMLDADRVALGAKVGYDAAWNFGPVGVTFEAWIAANALVNWNPLHFHGELLAHGKVALSAFGFSMGASIDARIAADVDDPFHLIGEFAVAMNLPWPLPDPSVDVTLEWGPKKAVPPLPRPLEGAAVGHQRSTARWPLGREEQPVPEREGDEYPALLTPDYAEDGLLGPEGPDATRPDPTEAPPDPLPVVPPDGRPQLTFATPVHDDGMVGVNHQPVKPPREVVGDPAKNEGPVEVRYGLQAVRLKRYDGTGWTEVSDLYGSWAPVPKSQAGTGGASAGGGAPALSNTKLELYSKNPFDYGRHADGRWEEGTQRLLADYPCTVDVDCYDFDGLTDADFADRPVTDDGDVAWHERSRLDRKDWPTFAVQEGEARPVPRVSTATTPAGRRAALVYPRRLVEHGSTFDRDPELLGTRIRVELGHPHASVELVLGGTKHDTVGAVSAYDDAGELVGRETFDFPGEGDGGTFSFTAEDEDRPVATLVVDARGAVAFVSVCEATSDFAQMGPQETSGVEHTRRELARWADEAEVLEPNTVYRVEVDTVVEARGQSGGALDGFEARWYDDADPLTEFVYFRTGGPPGVAPTPSLPTTVTDPDTFATGVADLTRYVRGTVPETVPAEGERPTDPRPVYRAYDVGVDFAADHVETLYRLARRDLGIYLYDGNDRPVRDVDGRLVATANQWGKTDDVVVADHDRSWLRRVRESGCTSLDESTIPLADALTATPGTVLDAGTTYEARLSPRLLADPFDDGLHHWRQVGNGGPRWWTPGHDGTNGDAAEVVGSTAVLDGNPDTGPLAADADTIHFPSDRARPSGTYRITGVDPSTDTVTLDGDPALANDDTRWRVAPRHVLRQTASVSPSTPDEPASTLELATHPKLADAMQSPEDWTDYRVSATLRADRVGTGTVGLAVRRTDGDGYRFELDAARNGWRLVSVEEGAETELARYEDDDPQWAALEPGRDYRVVVEAVGSDLRASVDGVPVVAVDDETHAAGTVGVHCRGVADARVDGVSVDDYRRDGDGAPVPYRFGFTTSNYANFFHQLHSYQDETWTATVAGGASGATAVERLDAATAHDLTYATVGSGTTPDVAEGRSFDAALSALAGDGPLDALFRQRPDRVTVTRFDDEVGALAYLLQSPEPIDWRRTDVAAHVGASAPTSTPDDAKLTDVTLGSDESVTVLFRDETDPSDYAVDYRRSDEPGFDATLTGARFEEPFTGSVDARYDVVGSSADGLAGFDLDPVPVDATTEEAETDPADDPVETLADLADDASLERRFVTDFASRSGRLPPLSDLVRRRVGGATRSRTVWRIEDGALVGDVRGTTDLVARRGGSESGVWTTTIAATDPGEVGLLFRYTDEDDHYRFSVGEGGLRLLRRTGTTTDVLWHGTRHAVPDRAYRLSVVAADGLLRGYLDGVPTFVVDDPGGAGSVGVHAAAAGTVTVTALSAHEAAHRSVRYADDFEDGLDDWTFEDVPPYTTQESDWHVDGGRLRQTSNIYGHVGNEYHEPGTHGVVGDADWRDYRASVALGSGDDDAIGVIVRYRDRDNYYRFSMDHEREYRRLVKRVDGTTQLLWEDRGPYQAAREYVVTVECVGETLTGYLDGERLFSVTDDDLSSGRVGLYCRANDAAYFDDLRVTAPGDDWVPYYEFADEGVLPAGTRARIVRGARGAAEAGLLHRDLAPDGDAPARLPSSGVELRVRPPSVPVHAASTGHDRWFRPDGDYAPLDASMLRTADGTALLVVPEDPIDGRGLRLSTTYHRDGPGRTLRQAGFSDPERVVLDVPWAGGSANDD